MYQDLGSSFFARGFARGRVRVGGAHYTGPYDPSSFFMGDPLTALTPHGADIVRGSSGALRWLGDNPERTEAPGEPDGFGRSEGLLADAELAAQVVLHPSNPFEIDPRKLADVAAELRRGVSTTAVLDVGLLIDGNGKPAYQFIAD